MKKISLLVLILLCLTSCGGGSSDGSGVLPTPVQVDPPEIRLVKILPEDPFTVEDLSVDIELASFGGPVSRYTYEWSVNRRVVGTNIRLESK